MSKYIVLWGGIGILIICSGCGKKAAPIPRSQVVEKAASQKQAPVEAQTKANTGTAN